MYYIELRSEFHIRGDFLASHCATFVRGYPRFTPATLFHVGSPKLMS